MNRNGYTLVELLVTCSIIGILSLTSLFSINVISPTWKLRKEINCLYSHLQSAKIEAIKRNSFVVFMTKENGYTIFVDDGNGGAGRGDWIRQPEEYLIIDHTLPEDIELVKNSFTGNRTRFNGRVCMKGGRVILGNKYGRKKEIVISLVGRIRVATIPS